MESQHSKQENRYLATPSQPNPPAGSWDSSELAHPAPEPLPGIVAAAETNASMTFRQSKEGSGEPMPDAHEQEARLATEPVASPGFAPEQGADVNEREDSDPEVGLCWAKFGSCWCGFRLTSCSLALGCSVRRFSQR